MVLGLKAAACRHACAISGLKWFRNVGFPLGNIRQQCEWKLWNSIGLTDCCHICFDSSYSYNSSALTKKKKNDFIKNEKLQCLYIYFFRILYITSFKCEKIALDLACFICFRESKNTSNYPRSIQKRFSTKSGNGFNLYFFYLGLPYLQRSRIVSLVHPWKSPYNYNFDSWFAKMVRIYSKVCNFSRRPKFDGESRRCFF